MPQNEARIKELTGQMKVPSEETKQLAGKMVSRCDVGGICSTPERVGS